MSGLAFIILVVVLLLTTESRRILSATSNLSGASSARRVERYRSPEKAPANIIYRAAACRERPWLEEFSSPYKHCIVAVNVNAAGREVIVGHMLIDLSLSEPDEDKEIVKAGLPASHEDDEPLIAYIAWVEVSKGWEGKRIGTTLVSEGIRELRRLYPNLAAVWALVADTNKHARRLFHSLHFGKIKRDDCHIYVHYFNK